MNKKLTIKASEDKTSKFKGNSSKVILEQEKSISVSARHTTNNFIQSYNTKVNDSVSTVNEVVSKKKK